MPMLLSKRAFVFITIAIHAIYLGLSWYYQSWLNPDSADYIEQAYNLMHHGSLYARIWEAWPHDPGMLTLRPPLYGIMVLVTYTYIATPLLLLALQCVLSINIWIMLCKLILESAQAFGFALKESWVHAVLLGGLLLYPIQNFLACTIMSDTLFQYLFFIGAYFLIRFLITKRIDLLFWYNVFFTLALLTKPVLVYFAFANIGLSVYWYFKVTRHWKVLVFSMMMPLVIFLVSKMNEKETGYFHYSSSKVENLLIYNTTNLLNMRYGNDSGYVLKKEILRQSSVKPTYRDQCIFIDSACKRVILENSGHYAFYHAQGMLNFFMAPGREYFISFFQLQEPVRMSFMRELNASGFQGLMRYFGNQNPALILVTAISTLWNGLMFLGLLFFAWNRRIPWAIKIALLALIIYVAGVSSLAAGAARFRLPVYPLLIFCFSFMHLRPREKPESIP